MRLGILLVVGMLVLPLVNATAARLPDVAYPFPVYTVRFSSQQQKLEIALHGSVTDGHLSGKRAIVAWEKFTGAEREEMARALAGEGDQIIIPDQAGFGKSSKPEPYQFTFQSLVELVKQF